MLRFLAFEAFGFEGISARVAADGCEAVEYLQTLVAQNEPMPTIIFLDILMPCMDGQEVFKALAVEPFLAHMTNTTFVITSAAEEALNVQGSGLKMTVLYKPYEVGTLIDMIRRLAPNL